MGLPFICKALYWDNTKPSWIDTVFGFPDVPAIAGNALGRIFIGCNDGIYSSMDTGKTWQLYGQGIPPGVSVNSLLLDENGYLYAGTSSGVVYKSALSTVGVAKVPTSIPYTWMLEQNYPNPFNPSTLINYQISTLSKVSLKVYDLLGREIVTLINEEQSAGPHMVKWDASHVATGVYFYMLAAGGFVQTKKMLLMK